MRNPAQAGAAVRAVTAHSQEPTAKAAEAKQATGSPAQLQGRINAKTGTRAVCRLRHLDVASQLGL